jgi:hypothetical protein
VEEVVEEEGEEEEEEEGKDIQSQSGAWSE